MSRNQKRSLAKQGRPRVASKKITAVIEKILSKKATHARIAKEVGVSKTTVDRVSKWWNAMAWQGKDTTDLSDLSNLPEELSDARKKMLQKLTAAFTKASENVPKDMRPAIIKGVVAARLREKEIIDPVPLDPRLAFAPQQVEPEHKPPSRLETHTNRKKLR